MLSGENLSTQGGGNQVKVDLDGWDKPEVHGGINQFGVQVSPFAVCLFVFRVCFCPCLSASTFEAADDSQHFSLVRQHKH